MEDNDTILQEWCSLIVDKAMHEPGIYVTSTGRVFKVKLELNHLLMNIDLVHEIAESGGSITVRKATEQEKLLFAIKEDY